MSKMIYNLSSAFLRHSKAAFVMITLLVVAPGVTKAQITYGVTFGTSQNDGTPCVGKGVCKETSVKNIDNSNNYVNAEAVSATFQLSPDNQNVLMMSFLLSELRAKQPDQVNNFINPAGAYMFDANFVLANSLMSSQLNLPPNAIISTTSNSTVVVNGDIVTDYITLSTN